MCRLTAQNNYIFALKYKQRAMNSLDNFAIQKPRPLPVIVAVDRSGSMSMEGKIDALNLALKNFVASLQGESNSKAEIQVALYSFGRDTATCDIPLTPVSAITDVPVYEAYGRTPMGMAFNDIKSLLESRDKIPSRAYKPTIVLITDGIPTDNYVGPMESLIKEGRSAKAFRMAMAIGEDADRDMLAEFVSDPEYLISGDKARDIVKFFKYVTMSVTSRTKSQSPDNPVIPPYPADDIIEF